MFPGLQKEKNDSISFLIRQKYCYKFRKKKEAVTQKLPTGAIWGWLGQHKFDDGDRATFKKRVSPISFGDGSSTRHYSWVCFFYFS
jgi:hypothetical protein